MLTTFFLITTIRLDDSRRNFTDRQSSGHFRYHQPDSTARWQLGGTLPWLWAVDWLRPERVRVFTPHSCERLVSANNFAGSKYSGTQEPRATCSPFSTSLSSTSSNVLTAHPSLASCSPPESESLQLDLLSPLSSGPLALPPAMITGRLNMPSLTHLSPCSPYIFLRSSRTGI